MRTTYYGIHVNRAILGGTRSGYIRPFPRTDELTDKQELAAHFIGKYLAQQFIRDRMSAKDNARIVEFTVQS